MTYSASSAWLSADLLADPYPLYKSLRESRPVHFDQLRQSWVLARYHDVERVLRDDAHFTAEQGVPNSMLVSDPPRHTRLRGLVSKAFTPRTVRQLRPRIQEIAGSVLDAVAGRTEFDVIDEFAYPLPITVIAELLGVEPEHRDFFRIQSQKIALSLGPNADPRVAERATEGRAELVRYFNGLIARRRVDPRDDIVTAMIGAEDRGDVLNHGEMLAMLLLLLVGGHETTVNLIGNGLLALLRNPDQLEMFRDEEGIERQAVDELLRYDPPAQYTGRIARKEVEIGGQTIRTGDRVRLILASANRDAEVFDEPDRLDLTRNPCDHLSFGIGVHFCLGAELARLEGEIALSTIVRRFPHLRLTGQALRWRPAPVLRGLEALPLAL